MRSMQAAVALPVRCVGLAQMVKASVVVVTTIPSSFPGCWSGIFNPPVLEIGRRAVRRDITGGRVDSGMRSVG